MGLFRPILVFFYKKNEKKTYFRGGDFPLAGDVFEDEGFLASVQSFELTQLDGDGRVMFQLSKNEVEIFANENFAHKLFG